MYITPVNENWITDHSFVCMLLIFVIFLLGHSQFQFTLKFRLFSIELSMSFFYEHGPSVFKVLNQERILEYWYFWYPIKSFVKNEINNFIPKFELLAICQKICKGNFAPYNFLSICISVCVCHCLGICLIRSGRSQFYSNFVDISRMSLSASNIVCIFLFYQTWLF